LSKILLVDVDSKTTLKGISWDKKELEDLYWNQGLLQREIGNLKGVSRSDVERVMRRLGVPTRKKGEALRHAYQTGKIKRVQAKGALSNHWKGGRCLVGGYVYIHNPEHPKATKKGYVLESIMVWERTNEEQLPSGWVVHHLNGVKSDNRPENLVAMPKKKHSMWLYIQELQKRIRQLENSLRA